MKKGILFLLLAVSFAATAQQKQSLKDLLYSGKLKSDSNTVVRKDDDLSAKIDTATKKPETKAVVISDSMAKAVRTRDTISTTLAPVDTAVAIEPVTKETAAPVKSNTKIWKEYADSLATTLKAEVLSSKKIKKEEYFITVDYEIGADGAVSITTVTTSPENEFLQNAVKERIAAAPPQLAPVVGSDGKARKVKRKYNFSITKD